MKVYRAGVTLAGALCAMTWGTVDTVHAQRKKPTVCVTFVQPGDVLWIHSRPDSEAEKLGSLPHDECNVQVRWNECVTARGEEWCPVSYRTVTGWSNARYLSDEW